MPASAFRPNPKLQGGLHSYCRECAAEKQRRWRAANRDKQQLYNERQRAKPVELACLECGARFEGRPNRLVCGGRCRERRKTRQRREARAGAAARLDPAQAWDDKHGKLVDLSAFQRDILPLIQDIPLSRLQQAPGLSLRYVSLLRRGDRTPHPRHWQALLEAQS